MMRKTITPFKIFNTILMLLILCVTLFPFLNIFAVSFSGADAVLSGEVTLIPKSGSLAAYKNILQHPNFWKGYRNTIFYTIAGTGFAMVLTILCAYPLSKKDLPGRPFIMGFIVFTMLFNGGLIPNFLLIRNIGFINTVWAIIIPMGINVWNMIIMRTFFMALPESLEEAAEIDGLNPLGILLRITLPLSKPILATIGLFYAVWFWNDWFRALIFLNTKELHPITLFLRNIVMGAQLAAEQGLLTQSDTENVSTTIKAASIILVTTPILLVYPFIQRYFVKGIMIGSVKG
jgi:putative aldouronate transport system permease protein